PGKNICALAGQVLCPANLDLREPSHDGYDDAREQPEEAGSRLFARGLGHVLAHDVEVSAEGGELVEELLISAANDADVRYARGALRRQCSDDVGVTATQVGHDDVGAGERRRAGDDRGLLERATGDTAVCAVEAVAV